jgi:glycosyltransferase involved in cell wall biosynthesis
MNIGIDSHSAERDGEGNATYSRGLISALLNGNGKDSITLFAADPAHPFYRRLDDHGGPRIVRVTQGAGMVRLLFALGRAAAGARVDCLHVQYFAPFGYRGRVVVTVHDLGFLHVPEAFPRALRVALRVLVPQSLARASHVITASEFSRQDIAKRYGVDSDRITAIPLAAQTSLRPLPVDDSVKVLSRYGLQPGFVFALGRLNRRKNLGRLIRACLLLRTSGNADLQLVIAGKPDFGAEEMLGQTRQPSHTSMVRWVGLLPEEDLPAFYSAAAAFVYPSLFEGFGLPILEAMACGTPVIASTRASIPELVGDAGLLVDPEDVQALAAAMARVLLDRALADELARRSLVRSRQYSWEETARRTLAVYRRAATGL